MSKSKWIDETFAITVEIGGQETTRVINQGDMGLTQDHNDFAGVVVRDLFLSLKNPPRYT